MRWGLRTQSFLRIFVALVISISLFPRVAHAEDDEQQYVFPFSKVAVHYPKDHLGYPAADVEGCYARILAPTAGVISQLRRRDKWTPEKDSPGTRGGLTITLKGDDGVRYFFSHLGRVKVLKNQRVAAGDWIAVMGSSGNARVTRCHTHFGMSRVCRWQRCTYCREKSGRNGIWTLGKRASNFRREKRFACSRKTTRLVARVREQIPPLTESEVLARSSQVGEQHHALHQVLRPKHRCAHG
jgi:hypothetical protein